MKKCIIAALVTVVMAMPAWAQGLENGQAEMEDAFRQADIITDDRLDAGEFDIYHLTIFSALDEDDDGALIKDECYSSCFPTGIETDETTNGGTMTHYLFEAVDADRNGQVIQSEYISYARKQFKNYDRDENKFLSKEEFFAFYQGMDERTFMVKGVESFE